MSFAAIAVGTETDGIICPSAMAGLVGLKPTVELVSRSGVVPIAAPQFTPTIDRSAFYWHVVSGSSRTWRVRLKADATDNWHAL